MQALYAFFQSKSDDLAKGERELFRSIEKVHELYFYLLLLITELADFAQTAGETEKYFPTQEDKALAKFYENKVIFQLKSNSYFINEIKEKRISWKNDIDLVKKLFLEIKKSEYFKKYIHTSDNSYQADKDFLLHLFQHFIAESAALQNFLEEKNIYWCDNEDWTYSVVIKTIKVMEENSGSKFLLPLYKNEDDDKYFVKELFCMTILHNEEYEKLIGVKTKNWEVDRIAFLDIILMKMNLAEIMTFPSIPIKVSINEYLDIAKEFSTYKSSIFINGVIDKLVIEMKQDGKIQKRGRGLIEESMNPMDSKE